MLYKRLCYQQFHIHSTILIISFNRKMLYIFSAFKRSHTFNITCVAGIKIRKSTKCGNVYHEYLGKTRTFTFSSMYLLFSNTFKNNKNNINIIRIIVSSIHLLLVSDSLLHQILYCYYLFISVKTIFKV